METKKLHFETLQLHVGQEQPDPATDARAVPIYQTTSYVFRNSAHAAAITYAFENITRAGDHIVAAKTIYGGTYNLLAHTLPAYGVTTTFVDPGNLDNFEKAIQENTKAVLKSLVVHPATTTHSQLSARELEEQGIKPGTVRLSIGTEHIDDLLDDLSQAFDRI